MCMFRGAGVSEFFFDIFLRDGKKGTVSAGTGFAEMCVLWAERFLCVYFLINRM